MGTDLTRWHYTFGDFLVHILRDGWLELSTEDVHPPERRALWFSTNPLWENTANKLHRTQQNFVVRLTKEELHERLNGLARIGVHAADAPYDWDAYKRMSGISLEDAERLRGSGNGNPAEWWVSFGRIPASKWVAVEVWNRAQWLPSPGWAPLAQAGN